MSMMKGIVIGVIIGLLLGVGVGYGVFAGQLSAKDTQIAGLQGYVSTLQGEVTWLQSQIDEFTTQVAGLERQLTELEIKLAEEPNVIAVSFSRYEYTRGQLIDWISKANKTVYVMVMALTADQLADALIAAHNKGVNVTIIIDDQYRTSAGSDYQRILNAGIDIRTDNSWRLMHHKVMIVDGYILVTGSYNWSAAAEDDNWENIIILESETVSATYLEEFNRIWQQTTPGA